MEREEEHRGRESVESEWRTLGRVDAALRGATALDEALERALQVLLESMACDRAWLLFPCDPEAETWQIPVEVTRPEFPGAMAGGRVHGTDPEVAALMAEVLEGDTAVAFDPTTTRVLPAAARAYEVRSQFCLAVHPRTGPAWMLGLHQCTHERVWSDGDRRLFERAGHRIAEALTSLLFFRQLQRSEDRVRLLLAVTPDTICFKDERGRWLVANEATLASFGLEGRAYEGCRDADLLEHCTLNRDVLRAREEVDARAYADGHPTRTQETLVSADGTRRVFDVLRIPVEHADGRSRGLVIVGRDVTELQHAEEARRRLEATIQHAQKLESLGVLAGGIAHDFNNLLMGVMGHAGLALNVTPEASPCRPHLYEIEAAARRAADLANQMLAYSGKGRFVVKAFDLNDLVEEMLHLLQVTISKKAVLRVNACEDLPSMHGDLTQIRQVIMNLITNASDAIGERSGVISITLGAMHADRDYLAETYLDEDLEPGLYVYVEVSDTGCGMDPDTRRRIFDPFFTTKTSGRGLGMAAVLGIVRGHRGAIKIYSEPGKGTSFKVLFPALDRPAEPVREPAPILSEEIGGGTILVADDEETVRSIAKATLEAAGLDVLLAEDGRQAVELLRAHGDGIRAVLLDMTMPHLSGLEAFSELRRLRADLPIILSSGYNEQDATSALTGKGLAGFLQKPYRPNDLLQKLREVLAPRSS